MAAVGYSREEMKQDIDDAFSEDLKRITISTTRIDNNKLITDTFFVDARAIDKLKEILNSDAWRGHRKDFIYLDEKI